MRKVIFSIPITLDGFIEGPQRELDWVIPDDQLHDFYTNLLQEADLIVYGRVTYELMANYWPVANSDPNATASMKQFANTLNPLRKLVYSKTLKRPGWNTELKQAFDPKEIQELKSRPGKTILLGGGAAMAQTFFNHGLVDEYIPVIHPVVIGHGKALFGGLVKLPLLDFQWIQKFSSSTVAVSYRIDSKL
jgi:dihydrofolate reductase